MRVELSRNTETPMPVPNTRVSMFSARMHLTASASISTWRNSAGVCSHVHGRDAESLRGQGLPDPRHDLGVGLVDGDTARYVHPGSAVRGQT